MVISEDNPADQPSRNKPVEAVRVERMLNARHAQDRGKMTASMPWKPLQWKGERRLMRHIWHEMYDEDEGRQEMDKVMADYEPASDTDAFSSVRAQPANH